MKNVEKNILYLQKTIAKVYSVQNSSCSEYCITTGIMLKTQRMAIKTFEFSKKGSSY